MRNLHFFWMSLTTGLVSLCAQKLRWFGAFTGRGGRRGGGDNTGDIIGNGISRGKLKPYSSSLPDIAIRIESY